MALPGSPKGLSPPARSGRTWLLLLLMLPPAKATTPLAIARRGGGSIDVVPVAAAEGAFSPP
jgi:hypothetical protein